MTSPNERPATVTPHDYYPDYQRAVGEIAELTCQLLNWQGMSIADLVKAGNANVADLERRLEAAERKAPASDSGELASLTHDRLLAMIRANAAPHIEMDAAYAELRRRLEASASSEVKP